MGTFHDGKGDLHGVTVVVETTGSEIYVGRCDEDQMLQIVLLDADLFDYENDEQKRTEYLERVTKVGHWKKHTRVAVPKINVKSIRRLGELSEPS